jgi:thioredoxin 1
LRRAEQFLNANEETFEKVVLNAPANKIVLVDFYAVWCKPCDMLSPVLKRIADDPSARAGSGWPLDLVTVDIDQQLKLAQKYEVRSLPTVIAFKEGEPVDQFVGAQPESEVRLFLQTV